MTFRDEPLWYCLRTGVRQEAAATRLLRAELGLEVFCPRIRFKRPRATGVTWVHEAMFPGYLFVKFAYPLLHRRIAATSGVARILSFGGRPCVVEDSVIRDLRRHVNDGETVEISPEIREGEEVKIVEGPLSGVRALVSRVLPAQERIAILLSMLGEEREIEVSAEAVLPDLRHPLSGGKAPHDA